MSVIVLLDWGVEDWMAKLHVKAPRRMTTTCLETALTVNVGCDIDGHGLADIRKMHLAKSLDDAKLLNRQTGIDNSNDESDQGSTESPRAKALDRLEKELEGLEMRVAYFVPRRGEGGWRYDASFRLKSSKQIIDEIVSDVEFAAEFNQVHRAAGRVGAASGPVEITTMSARRELL